MRAAAHKLAQSLPLPYITLEITRMRGNPVCAETPCIRVVEAPIGAISALALSHDCIGISGFCLKDHQPCLSGPLYRGRIFHETTGIELVCGVSCEMIQSFHI